MQITPSFRLHLSPLGVNLPIFFYVFTPYAFGDPCLWPNSVLHRVVDFRRPHPIRRTGHRHLLIISNIHSDELSFLVAS